MSRWEGGLFFQTGSLRCIHNDPSPLRTSPVRDSRQEGQAPGLRVAWLDLTLRLCSENRCEEREFSQPDERSFWQNSLVPNRLPISPIGKRTRVACWRWRPASANFLSPVPHQKKDISASRRNQRAGRVRSPEYLPPVTAAAATNRARQTIETRSGSITMMRRGQIE